MNKNEPELSVKDLWARYYKGRENGDGELYRNKLIECYQGLVKRIAKNVRRGLPSCLKLFLGLEDLESYGVFGLINSIERYNPFTGVEFDAYAFKPVRGSILNGIRDLKFAAKIRPIPLKSIGKEKVKFIKNDSRIFVKIISYNDELESDTRSERNSLKRCCISDPCIEAQKRDFEEFLKKVLTREEKLILNLRYSNYTLSNSIKHSEREKRWNGVPWKEIAKIIGNISEGAVRLKHKGALEKIRSKLESKGLSLEDCLNNL